MHNRDTYPTDHKDYDELLEFTYGNFNEIALETPLIDGTNISKRFCKLFPKVASSQIQQLRVSAEDKLMRVIGQNFANMIVTSDFHNELSRTETKEELTLISTKFHLMWDQGYDPDRIPSSHNVDFSQEFKKGYQKLVMPFTNKRIPYSLIEKTKQAFSEFKSRILVFSWAPHIIHPVKTFEYRLQKIAEDYYQDKLTDILTVYPVFSDGVGACMSEWNQVITIKWCDVIQDYIRAIEDSQYQRESELLNVLSEKAVSLEMFMSLSIETALILQNEAEQQYQQRLENKQQTKSSAEQYPPLILWRRGEKNLQSLWKILAENGYIEHKEFHQFLCNHFQLVDKVTDTVKVPLIQKIVWKSSTVNLLEMVEALERFNIISAHSFNRKTSTGRTGRIRNLIHSHFCRPNNKEISLAAIRQAAHRRIPEMKIDYGFNHTILKSIRSMQ